MERFKLEENRQAGNNRCSSRREVSPRDGEIAAGGPRDRPYQGRGRQRSLHLARRPAARRLGAPERPRTADLRPLGTGDRPSRHAPSRPRCDSNPASRLARARRARAAGGRRPSRPGRAILGGSGRAAAQGAFLPSRCAGYRRTVRVTRRRRRRARSRARGTRRGAGRGGRAP